MLNLSLHPTYSVAFRHIGTTALSYGSVSKHGVRVFVGRRVGRPIDVAVLIPDAPFRLEFTYPETTCTKVMLRDLRGVLAPFGATMTSLDFCRHGCECMAST
jgi:hypothetical protein